MTQLIPAWYFKMFVLKSRGSAGGASASNATLWKGGMLLAFFGALRASYFVADKFLLRKN